MKLPIAPFLVCLLLSSACQVGAGPGTKAAATATAVARATVVAGPAISQLIEVGDPAPFGQQQVAVTVANRAGRPLDFSLRVVFQIGDRTLTTEKVVVKDLRAGRRQVVYLTVPEPLPSQYDAARVEVDPPD